MSIRLTADMRRRLDALSTAGGASGVAEEDAEYILRAARGIAASRLKGRTVNMSSPDLVRKFLRSHLTGLHHEVFGLILLDARHAVIDAVELFRGTVDGASVHPREVVRTCLSAGATAVVLYHNHPSGNPEPSRADVRITARLKSALDLVDVRVLDHLVAGKDETVSLSERGLL